jgi:DNA-binding transcriptional LysR family regulator
VFQRCARAGSTLSKYQRLKKGLGEAVATALWAVLHLRRACERPATGRWLQARRRAIPITEVAAEPLIGLTREDYPNYYDFLSIIFSKLKQKPRVVEEHDSFFGIISAVEAGTGVAIGADFGYSFGNRVKFLHITPEPKPISVGIVGTKGRLSPAAEKFWQCAKQAAAAK